MQKQLIYCSAPQRKTAEGQIKQRQEMPKLRINLDLNMFPDAKINGVRSFEYWGWGCPVKLWGWGCCKNAILGEIGIQNNIFGLDILNFILILQYNMWNAPFTFSPFMFFLPDANFLPACLAHPAFFQPLPQPTKELDSPELLLQNKSPPARAVKGPKQQKPKLCQGKSRKLSIKQKFRRKRERQDNFQRKKQKKDRNLPSNIIKNFFQYLHNQFSLEDFLKTRISSQNKICIDDFAAKLKRVIAMQKSYVRPSVMHSLCREEGLTKDESLNFRIILRRFLFLQEPMFIASRANFKKYQKLDYLRTCRKLWEQIVSKDEDAR